MPGYFNLGTGRNFVPFFKEDSVHFGKIKMEKELISIHLYKAFAVIKGEYWMQNLTDEDIILRTGFPINGTISPAHDETLSFDDLYNLKVIVNNSTVQTFKLEDYFLSKGKNYYDEYFEPLKLYNDQFFAPENWYVWEAKFPKNSTIKITVYYMVNTSSASHREGYSVSYQAGLGYILESGAAWGNEIGHGDIVIRLKEGLKPENIRRLLPHYFQSNKKDILHYEFNLLQPDYTNNIILLYDKDYDEYYLDPIFSNAKKYYDEIDQEDFQNYLLEESNSFTSVDSLFIGEDENVFSFLNIAAAIGIIGVITLIYFLLK